MVLKIKLPLFKASHNLLLESKTLIVFDLLGHFVSVLSAPLFRCSLWFPPSNVEACSVLETETCFYPSGAHCLRPVRYSLAAFLATHYRTYRNSVLRIHSHPAHRLTVPYRACTALDYLITPLARVTLALARPFSRSVSRDPINSASRHSLLPGLINPRETQPIAIINQPPEVELLSYQVHRLDSLRSESIVSPDSLTPSQSTSARISPNLVGLTRSSQPNSASQPIPRTRTIFQVDKSHLTPST
ncbi:hypothetical protein MJO28_014232 [Puccinia striiformis f. sp. tritici]|uniref:Uncharacterized protein n=1 Tax=Puccinia striiformis f. sp. tritici TaxID=168172 RepID=A0ACC0DVW1_9BASI|nr:hypothetical protein MJO28_014232 [Puccinia striiformis f. sp. tritici]